MLTATRNVAMCRCLLQEEEDRYLLEDYIDGRNEAIRAAQLRDVTGQARDDLYGAEDEHLKARSALESAKATFAAWKTLARLLAGERE